MIVRDIIQSEKISFAEKKFLVERATGFSLTDILLHPLADTLSLDAYPDLVAQFTDIVRGIPFDYVVGESSFLGYDFTVSPQVLIPRPETELLVESVYHHARALQACSILDLGTGSGVIGISLARMLPEAQIFASDISAQVFMVAATNRMKHRISNLNFVCADLFSAFRPGVFDMIVSNPPYVPDHLLQHESSLSYEPRLALSGGKDGLSIIRKILQCAGVFLRNNGMLFFEIGISQVSAITEIIKKTECFRLEYAKKDYAGITRILGLRKIALSSHG